MDLKFSWDPDKARKNLAKHGIGFEHAREVFLDPLRLDRIQYHAREERVESIGRIQSLREIAVVISTQRNGVRRIISARKALKNERRRYLDD